MAQDLLSHAVRSGDLSQVFDRALDTLVEDVLRRRFAVTDAPKSDGTSTAREPAAVRRAVYLRDRGRCTYVAPDGRRCEARRFLQFDHIRLRADRGEFTVGNIRLRCGPHNRLESERVLGSSPSPPRWVITRPGTDKQRRLPPIASPPHGGGATG
jgi:5-methylcytosine-specific restriction endonuclease McrA